MLAAQGYDNDGCIMAVSVMFKRLLATLMQVPNLSTACKQACYNVFASFFATCVFLLVSCSDILTVRFIFLQHRFRVKSSTAPRVEKILTINRIVTNYLPRGSK